MTAADVPGSAAFEKEVRPLIDRYCVNCHNTQKHKGGVNLEKFKDAASVARDPKTWETILGQLRDRNMPPENKPQPPQEERNQFMTWVEHALDNLDAASLPKDPGRSVLHRLSRLEYNNTIRDLFGVDTRPADKFPPDGGGGGGFDNNAATLFVPPILMERYLSVAGEILDAARPEALFIAKPGGLTGRRAAAKKIFTHHVPRAFRRQVEAGEIDALLNLFDRAQKGGATFEDSVKLGLRSLLVSPHFLFRVETGADGSEARPVSDYELASRLSYFLWSSMPDEELFQAAAKKKLLEPATLQAQVQRMLRDPKSRAFAENFSSQWLRVKELKTIAQPDGRKFPEYTPKLRDSLYAEVVEFFDHLVRENRSLLEIIDADYTFANATLAKHYGLGALEGDVFQRVALTNRNRGGVLGMGGVLTLTSYPQRTSPVLRGKWVLDEILGTPPPPPPAMVKSLPADDRVRDGLTFRQKLEEHRKNPECASCHKRMDPLGFGLENFDAIGRWRSDIRGQPVDASGVMATGEQFAGPAELKKLLLQRKADFARNLSERMLAYALGRGLEYYDAPVVKQLAKSLAADDFRAQTLVLDIVKSYPFQYRRGRQEALPTASK